MLAECVSGNISGMGFARVSIRQGRIAGVEAAGPERQGEPVLSAGLVDIQINGFAGVDFSDPALDPELASSVLPHLWRTGTTSFCPTLITNSVQALRRNFRVLERARACDPRFHRSVPCYHLEGPYLSPGRSRGIHDPSHMHPPEWDEFLDLQEAAGGNIGIVTLAPELPGAPAFIARLRAAGVVAALGHTDASPEQIHAAVDAGARLSTHLGNGCAQEIDRHANILWPQLARDELSASIICDGFHLPPDLVRVILRMKGVAGAILITDATHVATLPPGRYSLVGTEIELLPSGKAVKADGSCLAGSALSMDQAVARFMRLSGASLEEALAAATRSPARLFGREGLSGDLSPGAAANLILARPGPDGLAVEATYLEGEEVFRARLSDRPPGP